jgi:hypothetical protein
MGTTRRVIFSVLAALLAACNSQSQFSPSGAAVTSLEPNQAVVGPTRGGAKSMTVQIDRDFADAKYLKIFDNLASLPSGKYWGGALVLIVGGGGSNEFSDNQLGAAFTPSANHTATVIEAAIVNPNLGFGTSGFTLSVNQDDKGVPGKALITAQLPTLPENGRGICCSYLVGQIPNGLALSGGKQYWVVLNGQNGQPSDAAGWAMNATDEVDPFLFATYCAYASKCPNGAGWYRQQGSVFGTGLAFAVLGSS